MKAEELTNDIFDSVFRDILKEATHGPLIIATWDIARRLWLKHRIPIKKQANVVREKMREWWNSYPWLHEPRAHKMICGVAVYLSSPMSYDYCALERGYMHTMRSLISVYQNQREFHNEEHGV